MVRSSSIDIADKSKLPKLGRASSSVLKEDGNETPKRRHSIFLVASITETQPTDDTYTMVERKSFPLNKDEIQRRGSFANQASYSDAERKPKRFGSVDLLGDITRDTPQGSNITGDSSMSSTANPTPTLPPIQTPKMKSTGQAKGGDGNRTPTRDSDSEQTGSPQMKRRLSLFRPADSIRDLRKASSKALLNCK